MRGARARTHTQYTKSSRHATSRDMSRSSGALSSPSTISAVGTENEMTERSSRPVLLTAAAWLNGVTARRQPPATNAQPST